MKHEEYKCLNQGSQKRSMDEALVASGRRLPNPRILPQSRSTEASVAIGAGVGMFCPTVHAPSKRAHSSMDKFVDLASSVRSLEF